MNGVEGLLNDDAAIGKDMPDHDAKGTARAHWPQGHLLIKPQSARPTIANQRY